MCASLGVVDFRELDEEESEVLAYRYLDDMTQEEIANLLGLSRKTIGKRLERIREAVGKIAKITEEEVTP